jgi:hypothetical protein
MIPALLALLHWFFSIFLFPVIHLLEVGMVLLLVVAVLSPFESLEWWAGWFGRPAGKKRAVPVQEVAATPGMQEAAHYLVYLSGIGAISGDYLEPTEIELYDELAARFPGTAVVKNVFPYAMNNRGLTAHRIFSWLWRAIKRLKIEGKERLLPNLINMRNLFQMFVSADRRYGPIYNYGTAEVIRDELLRQGYRPGSATPVSIIGYSGGGQIALGAATYLKDLLGGAPLWIISLGGVMADDPGLDHIEHLCHLYGSRDLVQKIGAIAYAGRWPWFIHSPWNRARAQGKITMIALGPIGHAGSKGYLSATSRLKNGQRFLDRSVEAISEVLEQQQAV